MTKGKARGHKKSRKTKLLTEYHSMSIDALKRVVLNTEPLDKAVTGDRVSAMFDVDRIIQVPGRRPKKQKGHGRYTGTVMAVFRQKGNWWANVKWDDDEDPPSQHMLLELRPFRKTSNRVCFDKYIQTDSMPRITNVSHEIVRVPRGVITLLYPHYPAGHPVPCRWVAFEHQPRLQLVPMASMPTVNPSSIPMAYTFNNLTHLQEEGKLSDLKTLFDPTTQLPLALSNIRPFVPVRTICTRDRMSILTHVFQHIIFGNDM